jgi:hypothetical protein
MSKFRSTLLAVGIGIIAVTCLCLQSWQNTRSVPTGGQQDHSASDDFIAHPNAGSWHRLVASGQAQSDGLIAFIAFHISLYDAAALQRDLPNSMTRNGHVEEYVEQQEEIMKREFDILRAVLPSSDARRLLAILCTQQFDERLVWTGAEITYRLSPSGLTDLAKSAKGENRRIMDVTQDRFRSGNGHIGDW